MIKSPDGDFSIVENMGNQGLSDIDDIISVRGMSCESCGCQEAWTYVFWNEYKFYHISSLSGDYNEDTRSDEIIFPLGMEYLPNLIIKRSFERFSDKAGERKLKYKTRDKFYIWDGETIQKSSQKDVIGIEEVDDE